MLRAGVAVALLVCALVLDVSPASADGGSGSPAPSLKSVVAALVRSWGVSAALADPPVLTPYFTGASPWPAAFAYESNPTLRPAATSPLSPRFNPARAEAQLLPGWQLFGRVGGLRWRSTLADCFAADVPTCTSIGVRPNGMPKLPGSLSVGLFLAF